MAATAQFVATATLDLSAGSTANTNRDGTGTIVTAASGVTSGKRINRVSIKSTVTTTAGTIRFYLSTDGGTTNRLVAEVLVTAITASGSVAAFESTAPTLPGLILPDANSQLRWSTNNAENFIVAVEGGTF